MRRVNDEELVFYDQVAERINVLLGCRSCTLNQSSLAGRIGWNRASLCNFLNRIDKSVAAHFIPKIADTLKVTVEHLMSGQATPVAQRTTWDSRSDNVNFILDKLTEFRQRKAHCMCLAGMLPMITLLNQAMVVNFVDSIVNGASQIAAENWHEIIKAERQIMKDEGVANMDYIIPFNALLHLPRRQPPYQGFTNDEVVRLLENLKNEWVRHRDMRIIAVDDRFLTPYVKLEMASSISLTVVGCETQVRVLKDLRIDWDEDSAAVQLSRDCLIRLKRSAGFGVRKRPTAMQVEQLIDKLLLCIEKQPRAVLIQNRENREWRNDIYA